MMNLIKFPKNQTKNLKKNKSKQNNTNDDDDVVNNNNNNNNNGNNNNNDNVDDNDDVNDDESHNPQLGRGLSRQLTKTGHELSNSIKMMYEQDFDSNNDDDYAGGADNDNMTKDEISTKSHTRQSSIAPNGNNNAHGPILLSENELNKLKKEKKRY